MQQLARQPMRFGCEWKLQTDVVVIGPNPVTVLQVEAIRDCEVTAIKVEVPDIPDDTGISIVVVEQVRASGKRLVRVERLGGPARVVGRENLGPFSGEVLLTNEFRPPNDFWMWSGSMELQKGQVVGIMVAATRHCVARVLAAGK